MIPCSVRLEITGFTYFLALLCLYVAHYVQKVIFLGQRVICLLCIITSLQLDVTSAQLLVTDNDFRDPDFRMQLNETVNQLLSLKVIPIFNENDAVSTRRAPYEVCI